VKKYSLKQIIATIVSVIGLVGGVWLVDDRYISAEELKSVMSTSEKNIYLQMDLNKQRALIKEEYEYRRMRKADPTNFDIQEEHEKIKKELDDVQKDLMKRGKSDS